MTPRCTSAAKPASSFLSSKEVTHYFKTFDNLHALMGSVTHNPAFELAVQYVNQTSRSVFLTGKAGTGKTTFLKFIRDNTFKKVAVTAPTGVAAINAGG